MNMMSNPKFEDKNLTDVKITQDESLSVTIESNRTAIPKVIDTSEADISHRFEYLNDHFCTERLAMAPVRDVENSGLARINEWNLGGVNFFDIQSAGHLCRRVGISATPFLGIRRYNRGTTDLWTRDGHTRLLAGDIMIYAQSPSSAIFSSKDLHSTNVSIPLDFIDLDPEKFTMNTILRSGSMANLMLSAYIEIWSNKLSFASGEDMKMLNAQIVETVRVALANPLENDLDQPTFGKRRGELMRQYIRDNILNDSLDVAKLCRFFNASRATIYREFLEEGGVNYYIKRRRMEMALYELAKAEKTRGRVSEVAYKFGYDDPLNFTKSFTRHFGFPPSDILSIPGSLSNGTTSA